MSRSISGLDEGRSRRGGSSHLKNELNNAAILRPTPPQRRYLERGLHEPGGKLPLFDRDGREVAKKTIEACIANGWAEPWTKNPIKPDWLVCRITPAGIKALTEPRTKAH